MKLSISNQGNLAIETLCFTLSKDELKAVERELKVLNMLSPGSYWRRRVATAKGYLKSHNEARVYTAGFGASEFANIAALCDVRVTETRVIS
jgi:hypothetical protein